MRIHKAPGQAMIISLLLLGFLTLSFIMTGSTSLMDEFQTNSVLENKALSAAYAEACAEQAMDRLGRSLTYAGNETVSVASSTCTIRPITATSSPWTIETSATSSNQHTFYRVILSAKAPPVISSWIEVSGF